MAQYPVSANLTVTYGQTLTGIVKNDYGIYHTFSGTSYSAILEAITIEDIPANHILSAVWNGTIYTVLYYK